MNKSRNEENEENDVRKKEKNSNEMQIENDKWSKETTKSIALVCKCEIQL